MKYYLFCTLALLLCLALGAAVVFPLLRRRRGLVGKLLLSLLLGLAFGALAGFGFLSRVYPAAPAAHDELRSDDAVTVKELGNGYFLDGPGTDAALIFYPGARVEAEAYAPLLRRLSERGLDCFLVKMPLNLAVFDMDAAEAIRQAYDYETWLLAGHSMGGAVAANLVCAHPGDYDALVLLAAYPSAELPEGLRLLSVYGSEDGCLDRGAYEKGRAFWPEAAEELVVEGGNHARFGGYGPQRGDGEAAVEAWEQQAMTAGAILELLE